MQTFEVTYRYHSRPRFKKGRARLVTACFNAPDLFAALRLARDEGRTRFHNRRWQVVKVVELPTRTAKTGE